MKLEEKDYKEAAEKLKVEIAVIKTVTEVESRGSGFLEDGKPKILFEGHVFWKQLEKKGISPSLHVLGNESILYPKWTMENYRGGIYEYARLERAEKIDSGAALMSASWGMFQIMGFNHVLCGFKDVESFVTAMKTGEKEHLLSFIQFIISNRMDGMLRDRQWAEFAKKYNGPGYKKNKYDEKLALAYQKFAK